MTAQTETKTRKGAKETARPLPKLSDQIREIVRQSGRTQDDLSKATRRRLSRFAINRFVNGGAHTQQPRPALPTVAA